MMTCQCQLWETNLVSPLGQIGGVATETEWFPTTGTDRSSCDTEYATATDKYTGFPGDTDAFLSKFAAGDSLSLCIKTRLAGGPWGPWQFASGAVVKAFRLNSYNSNVNFNALNAANALNTVSLTGLGSLYGSNVLRPSVFYRPRLAPAPKKGRSR